MMKNFNTLFALILTILLLALNDARAQRSTGINNTNPSSKAALHIKTDGSVKQGIIIPKLSGLDTTVLKLGLTNAEKGLVFYDTTNSVYQYWNGNRWYSLGGNTDAIGSYWQTNGNTLVQADTLVNFKYIGTNNDFPLIFATNGSQRMRISRNGNVAIGKTPSGGIPLQLKSNGIGTVFQIEQQANNQALFEFKQTPTQNARFQMYNATNNATIELNAESGVESNINAGNINIGTRQIGVSPTVDNFIYDAKNIGHYSLSWQNDTWNGFGYTAYLSGYSGMKFFTFGSQAMSITQGGNVGIGAIAPVVSLDISSKTDAIVLPKGTNVQRPTPASGMLRYNTTSNTFEGHNGTAWSPFQTGVSANPWTQTGANIFPTTLTNNVGIGTNTPSSSLHINNSLGNAILSIDAPTASTKGISFKNGGIEQWSLTTNPINGNLSIGNSGYGGTPIMINTTTGFLGLAITPALDALHLGNGKNIRLASFANLGTGIVTHNNNGVLQSLTGLSSQVVLGDGTLGTISNPWTEATGSIYPTTLANNIGIGISSPTNKLHVSTAVSSTYTAKIENTITSGTSGGALHVSSSGSRSIGNIGMLVQNLVTKTGGSNSTKIGLRVESIGTWGPATINQPNVGLWVEATGADANYAAIFNSGSVGIGTSAPTGMFHVASTNFLNTILTSSSTLGTWISLNNSSVGGEWFSIINTGSGNGEGAGKLLFNRNASAGATSGSILTLDHATSNVGIGTTAPSKKMHIVRGTPTLDYEAGVYASNSATNGAGFYGAMVYRRNTTNYGVFAHSDALPNTSPLGVSRGADGALVNFMSGGIVEGQISVAGNIVTYGAFTGVHYAVSDENNFERGLLVTLSGQNKYYHGNKDAEILHGIKLSTKANDSKLLGTYLGLIDPLSVKSLENPHQVMSVGNGEMWIVENGSNIEPGDYLISSEAIGHGMKENGQFEIANVIARASESVDWNKEYHFFNGVKHKKIAVFYESFIINNKANRLENELNNMKKEIEIIKAKIEVLSTPYHSLNQSKNK